MRLLLLFLCFFSATANADGFKILDFSRSDSMIKLELLIEKKSDINIENIFEPLNLDRQKLLVKIVGEASDDFIAEFTSFDFEQFFSIYQKSKMAPLTYSNEFESIRNNLNEIIDSTSLISSVINEAAKNDYLHTKTSHEKFSLDLPLLISLMFEIKPYKNQNEMDGSIEPPL